MSGHMTPRHRAHLRWVQAQVRRRLSQKYRRGVKEHGTHLEDLPLIELLEEAFDEAIDQVVYLAEAIRQARALTAPGATRPLSDVPCKRSERRVPERA